MNYEYNGNLLEEERIELVSKEIMNKYQFITKDEAKEIAMLEGKISENVTINDELLRLYNIMLVKKNKKNELLVIYNDYINLLNKNENSNISSKYYDLLENINNYLHDLDEFPYMEN